MPSSTPVSPAEYKAIGVALIRRSNQRKNWEYTRRSQNKDWATYFGIAPEVASNVWNKLVDRSRIPRAGAPKHLLFAYVLLKIYAGDKPMSKIVGCHFNTFTKWAWIFIRQIHDLHHEVIRFDNRFLGWDRTKTNASGTVDCTTFGCLDTFPFDKAMWDPKRSKAGLKYEVAHSIHNGSIIHWNGWFKGSVSDIKIFRDSLKEKLEAGECLESDSGCSGENCLKNPDVAKSRKSKQQKGVARARQEFIFCKMKKFASMRGIWIHSYDKHKLAVGALLVSIQLGFELGTVQLFDIEYEAEYF